MTDSQPSSNTKSAPGMLERAAARVLVVDDEVLIRWSLRRALKNRGFDPVEAGDAASALRELHANPCSFRAALLDYRLPDRHDLSLLTQVLRAAPDCAVIMMTAFADDQMKQQALAIGARRVIDKPFDVLAVTELLISESRR